MSKYDELKRLAEAVTPETEAMHVFGDGSYIGEHQVLVGASQKMRDIVASYFGPGSDDDWEFREHGSALACIEDYDKWIRANRLVVGARQILELLQEVEALREKASELSVEAVRYRYLATTTWSDDVTDALCLQDKEQVDKAVDAAVLEAML